MPRYLKHLAGKVADGTSAYVSRFEPLLRRSLTSLSALAARSVHAAAPVAAGLRRRLPWLPAASENTMPKLALAAMAVAGVLVIGLMSTVAGAVGGDHPPDSAAAAIGQDGFHDDRSSRDHDRRVSKPLKAKSGWAAPSTADISDTYGPRGWRDGEMHWGMDFAANMGEDIYAAYDGTVVMAQRYGGYGNAVVIKHADGVQTLYGHFSKLKVEAGDEVETGDVLGEAGETGDATGPHLHFEVSIDGGYVDPEEFLKDKGVKF